MGPFWIYKSNYYKIISMEFDILQHYKKKNKRWMIYVFYANPIMSEVK